MCDNKLKLMLYVVTIGGNVESERKDLRKSEIRTHKHVIFVQSTDIKAQLKKTYESVAT